MSSGRPRTPTNAQRRAARRPAARTGTGINWPFWAGVAAIAVIAVGIIVWLGGGSDSGSEAGQPAEAAVTGGSVAGELSQIKTGDFHSIAISPVDPNVVLYGHHGGVLRSTDGGSTWTTTSLGGETDDAMAMGFSAAQPQVVYAAGHDTFFKSTDGGQTWESPKTDLPATDIHGMAVSPDKAGLIYANLTRFGVVRSEDGGATWTKAAGAFPPDLMQISASSGGVVYAAGVQSGVSRSQDGGRSFQATGRPEGSVFTIAASATNADVVYAGTDKGLFASIDGGKTWTQRAVPGGGQIMVAGVGSNPSDVMVVAVQQDRAGHVFRSSDGGATWGPG